MFKDIKLESGEVLKPKWGTGTFTEYERENGERIKLRTKSPREAEARIRMQDLGVEIL